MTSCGKYDDSLKNSYFLPFHLIYYNLSSKKTFPQVTSFLLDVLFFKAYAFYKLHKVLG